MFKRSKDEDRTELDAAWEDEAPAAGAPGAADDAASTDPFPEPKDFDLTGDAVPLDDEAREVVGDAPFDEEESFAYDAESDEFTLGDAEGFTDDSHTDYYQYGQVKHGVHDAPEDPDAARAASSAAVVGSRMGRHGSGRSSKQAALDALPERQRHSRRVRIVLRVVVVLLLALFAALAYFGWHLFQESRSVVEQQTHDVVVEVEEAAGTEEVSQDAATANVKKTDIPPLLGLLGLTQEEAVARIGHGATVTLDSEVADEASPMTHRMTVVLADEPSDAKSGAPTVYLGMDAEGHVVTAGYSAATASLGYGALSFADAVTNGHVIEKTLSEAGLAVAEGSVELPSSEQYSTFSSDGQTLVKEQYAFDGQVTQDGSDYLWTSVLVYNYTAANATGNLADTVRQIYVYISEKEAHDAAVAAKAQVKKKGEKDASAEAGTRAEAGQAADATQTAQAAPADQPANAAEAQAQTQPAQEAASR